MEQQACPHCGYDLPPVADAFCSSCRGLLIPLSVDARPAAIRKDSLAAYLAYRDSPPTVVRLLFKSVRSWVFLIAVLGGSAGLLTAGGVETAAVGVLGMLAGVLLRDLAWFRAVVRGWHTLAAVLDWKRIEQLAANGVILPPEMLRQIPERAAAEASQGIQTKPDRRG